MGDKLVVAGPQGARFVVKRSRWNGSPKGPKTPGPTGGEEQRLPTLTRKHNKLECSRRGDFFRTRVSETVLVCERLLPLLCRAW